MYRKDLKWNYEISNEIQTPQKKRAGTVKEKKGQFNYRHNRPLTVKLSL
jgi:hypothetical protein